VRIRTQTLPYEASERGTGLFSVVGEPPKALITDFWAASRRVVDGVDSFLGGGWISVLIRSRAPQSA
jgi:hypothetical protein